MHFKSEKRTQRLPVRFSACLASSLRHVSSCLALLRTAAFHAVFSWVFARNSCALSSEAGKGLFCSNALTRFMSIHAAPDLEGSSWTQRFQN